MWTADMRSKCPLVNTSNLYQQLFDIFSHWYTSIFPMSKHSTDIYISLLLASDVQTWIPLSYITCTHSPGVVNFIICHVMWFLTNHIVYLFTARTNLTATQSATPDKRCNCHMKGKVLSNTYIQVRVQHQLRQFESRYSALHCLHAWINPCMRFRLW